MRNLRVGLILALGLHCGVTQAGVTYVHTDFLGSPAVLTNEAGEVISRSHYRPFGDSIEGIQQDVGYTGHQHDAELGLTYMQARYYDPAIGRVYSNDPVGYLGNLNRGNPIQGFNRYAYVNNNPYKYADPTGMFGEATAAGCAIAIEVGCAPGAAVGFLVDVVVWGSVAGGAIYVGSKAANSVSNESSESPEIDPGEVSGKTPEEIEKIAKEKGLVSKGPDPKKGKGAYTDPVTGKQRILVHPDADCGPHCHVNDSDGNRLDKNGNKVPPESPEAHLPLRE